MSKITAPELTSYAGGLAAIGGALTLNQWAAIAGIVTAALTFGLNLWYTREKNAREQRKAELEERESQARLAALGVKL